MIIRDERPDDEQHIRELLGEAFPDEPIGRLVDDLRAAGDLTISLVASIRGEIAGHVGFSPVAIAPCLARVAQLAPLAVTQSWRQQGIGAQLVRAGIERCRALDYSAIFVLGDPAYYGRFGFEPVAAAHLRSHWSGPHFMALLLRPHALDDCRFFSLAPAFDQLS